jgi:hypothetical protein
MKEMAERKALLESIVRTYFDALAKGDFDMIPYDDNVCLRTPLAPGGVQRPLVGKETLRKIWWAPLPSLVAGTKVCGVFFNDGLTAVVGEAEIEIVNPRVTLRVADRFIVNESSKILEQTNYFDPRDGTNPGWSPGE